MEKERLFGESIMSLDLPRKLDSNLKEFYYE